MTLKFRLPRGGHISFCPRGKHGLVFITQECKMIFLEDHEMELFQWVRRHQKIPMMGL